MRNSRICPENNAHFFYLMCENAHRAALTLDNNNAVLTDL